MQVLARLLACADRPLPLSDLPEVPIDGGTRAQRAAVRDELADFDRWIGPGRLQLRQVVFQPVAPPFGARYDGDGVVVLDVQLEDALVRTVTRHEICHALDDAEELWALPMEPLDEIADQLKETEALRDLSEPGWRGEAFAQTCEIDPFVMHLLATTCPEDDPRLAEIARWLLEHVWTETEPSTEAPLATLVGFQPPANPYGWIDGWVRATTDPALLEVALVEPTWFFTTWVVDRETGAVTDRDVEPVELPAIDGFVVPLSGDLTSLGVDGAVLGRLRVEVSELGSADGRALWLDDDGSWAPIRDGCWAGADGLPRDFFVADGRAWTAWFDGERFSWAAIGG